jgi:signal transduction histidine kinase
VRGPDDTLRLLAEAGALLAESLEYETTLQRVARLAVAHLADWCLVDLLEADGRIRRLAVAHADPARESLVADLRARFPDLSIDTPHTITRVLRTGQAWVDPAVDPRRLQAEARSSEHHELIRDIGFGAEIVVPLVARGRPLGTITLVSTTAGRYGPAELALAQELAARAALAIDNARLYRAAQDAVRTRDRFLALVAHDLKGPLTAIKGIAQLLRRQTGALAGVLPSGFADRLQQIDHAARRMTRVMDDLIDVARLEAGQGLALERREADLAALARRVVDEHESTIGPERLHLEIAAEPLGAWDVARLERVLDNLIGNAVKYSPEGGAIAVRVSADAGAALLSVRDEGIGVPADDRERIFEQFQRGSNAAGRFPGTGLGLFGVREIVHAHGGTIQVESEEGRGSTFVVRLPIAPPPA